MTSEDGGPQVGRHDLGSLQSVDAPYGGRLTGKLDVGTEPRQLLDVHEAVFKDVSR